MNRLRFRRVAPRGALMLEITVAAGMLGVLLLILNQAVASFYKQADALDDHRFAQQTLENLMEEFTSQEWSDLQTASIAELPVSEVATSKLAELAVTGEVVVQADPVPNKRVRMQLDWRSGSGLPRTLALTAWVYQREEE